MVRMYEMTPDTLDAFILGVSDGQTTQLRTALLIAQIDAVSTLFEAHHHVSQTQVIVNNPNNDLGRSL